MNNETKNENWLADEPILILRYARQKDTWLRRKIDFVRNMFDLAYKIQRFDLCEKYRSAEDLFIKTRIFKNAPAKEKRAIKKSLEQKAIQRLKFLWINDYENFINSLNAENETFFDKYKTNFDIYAEEILFYATSYETTDEIIEKSKKAKYEDEQLEILTKYPVFVKK